MVNRSLLLVHAHPDDESIGTGATMAKYAAEGARVTLVTCTLGELGEIIPPDLSHLLPDELGQHRIVELDRACRALGVEDHRFLGGEGKYRDSGMMGLPDNDDPRCFWQASVEEAAADLVKVIEEVAPDVIVTYDANGFYGHPDHIQAHRVAWRANQLAGRAAKFYATAMPRSALAAAVELPGDSWFVRSADLSVSVPDDQVTTEIDAARYLPAKLAAMKAHETQITVDGAVLRALGRGRPPGARHRVLHAAGRAVRPGRPSAGRAAVRARPVHAVTSRLMGTSQRSLITGLGYLALFVLGLAQGLIGSFQYGRSPAPLFAIILILILFATCVLAGWGLRTYAAGILPALGWIIASFILAMPRPNGSVIIQASSAGEWYLYGGALAAAAGAAVSFFAWMRTRSRPR